MRERVSSAINSNGQFAPCHLIKRQKIRKFENRYSIKNSNHDHAKLLRLVHFVGSAAVVVTAVAATRTYFCIHLALSSHTVLIDYANIYL